MQHIFKCRQFRHQGRGVSLVEATITLAIAAVLVTVAVPPLSQLLKQVRESSLAGTFAAAVYLTRNEAIHRNDRVVMCKSANGLSCTTAGGWEQGWIIFHDVNANGTPEPEEALLQVQLFSPGNLRLIGNGPVANYISFTGLGLPKLLGGSFQAGKLTLCSQSAVPVRGRNLVLSKPGNLRAEKADLDQCG